MEMANKLLKVVTDELLLIYEERQIFDKKLLEIATSIPKNSNEFDTPKLEKKKRQSVVEKKWQPLDEQFTRHVQTAIKLSSSINSLESYLDVLSNDAKIAYSVILDIGLNLANLRPVRFDIPAQRRIIQISVQNLAEVEKSVKKKSLAFDENAQGVISLANPWLTMIDYLSRLTNYLANLLDSQETQARDRVIETITQSDSIEKLPSVTRRLEELNTFGEKYGSPLDEIINKLEDISRDADSAMAMKGYSQRLGIQDVLDKINNLRGLLSTRFLHEAADIIEPLDKLANSIYKSIHADSEKNTVGFRSPYLAGNPIPEVRSDLFKGRLDLADKIVRTLRSRTASTFVLYGPRRMGKSSFLLQLPRLLPSEFIPAYFDVQGGGTQTEAQFLYNLASSLFRQINRFLDNIIIPDLAVFEKNPFIAFNEWLDALQPRLSGKSIFFTIDEFEAIGKGILAGTLTENVLGHMRSIMQHNPNIILLFAGVHTIDALGPNAASYFISAYPLEISYLTEKDAEELIINPDPSAGELPRYDDTVITEIIRLTKCQPYLLQEICNEVLGVANERSLSQIIMPTLNEAVSRALSTSLYFKNVWEESQKDGQNILRSIIKKPVTSFTGKKKLIAEDMQKKRVIRIADDGFYAIEIPLVEMWLRNQLS
jgi:AAA+ ATPase superfamily predicted ATPase